MLVPQIPITVAETPTFMRQAAELWSEAERIAFVDFSARNPDAGDVIPETGGIRKARWSRAGTGKRGGVRVIYFVHDTAMPICLLMVYAKSDRDDLSPEAKRAVRLLVARLTQAHSVRPGRRRE